MGLIFRKFSPVRLDKSPQIIYNENNMATGSVGQGISAAA